MGGRHHAGLAVGKQHRGAISGQHADRDARRRRHDGIGARALGMRARRVDDDGVGAVHLMRGQDDHAPEVGCNARPVLAHGRRLVLGAEPAVEASAKR